MALHRVYQPILHDRSFLGIRNLDLENRVVARGRTKNRAQLLGIDLQGLRPALAAINNGGNLPGEADAPRGVLPSSFPGRCIHYDLFHKFFLVSLPPATSRTQVGLSARAVRKKII